MIKSSSCSHCGSQVGSGSKFCPNCGRELFNPALSEPQSTSQPVSQFTAYSLPQSPSVQTENIVDILESTKQLGHILVFTSTRIIILKNRNRAISNIAPLLVFISIVFSFFLFRGDSMFGLVIGPFWVGAFWGGAIGVVVPFFIYLIFSIKADKIVKELSKVPIGSLLRMKHEEVTYSQVEKVVFWGEKKLNGKLVQHLGFSYIISGKGKKEKRFDIEGTMYQENLEMLNTVLCGKVTGNLDTLIKEPKINREADTIDNKNSCTFCIHDLSKACPYPKLNVDIYFRKNKRCENYEYNTKIRSP
jgi:hypothetical protein